MKRPNPPANTNTPVPRTARAAVRRTSSCSRRIDILADGTVSHAIKRGRREEKKDCRVGGGKQDKGRKKRREYLAVCESGGRRSEKSLRKTDFFVSVKTR